MHLKALSMFAAVLLVAACAGQEMESVSSEGTMERVKSETELWL